MNSWPSSCKEDALTNWAKNLQRDWSRTNDHSYPKRAFYQLNYTLKGNAQEENWTRWPQYFQYCALTAELLKQNDKYNFTFEFGWDRVDLVKYLSYSFRWDLNPHMLPYLILSQTCLPIPARKVILQLFDIII